MSRDGLRDARALIDIGGNELPARDDLGRARTSPGAALVREAVTGLLARHGQTEVRDAFGLWGGRQDRLAYQEQVRREW